MNRRQRRLRARLLRFAVVGPVVLLAAAWLVGAALPGRHVEEVRALLPASAETVWSLLVDLDGMPDWRPGLRQLERLPEGSGPGAVRWREVGIGGRVEAWERVETVPPIRLVVRPAGADRLARRRVYRLLPVEQGTELAIREEQQVDHPLRRTLTALFGGNREPIERLARDLDTRLKWRDQVVAVGIR